MNDYLGGHYEVIRKIGGDGFGVTYLALDHHRPGKPECIVKQLRPDRHDPMFVTFFDREAEALEKLGHHPQIPQLLAHFEENQQFYIIQAKVDGKDLRDEIGQRPRSEGYVIDLLLRTLTVLKFVHDQRVIHRDLKPGNLMRHRNGHIFLIDFGIVKELSTMVVHRDGDVRSTIGIGTPGYMAPEQGIGKPRYASDIYALGMTAIYALTGVSPKQLQEDSKTGEVIWQKGVGVRPDLAGILTKMVRQNWTDRYPDAAQTLQALNELIAEREKPPVPVPDPKPKLDLKLHPKAELNKPFVMKSEPSIGRRGALKWLGYGGMGLVSASIGSGASLWLASQKAGNEPLSIRSPEPTSTSAQDAVKDAAPTPEATPSLATRRVEFPTAQLNETGGIASQGKGQVTVYSEDLGGGITLEMASISGGTFLMGSPPGKEEGQVSAEQPQHSVTVPGFWMGQFEVTQAQWKRVAAMEKVSIDLDEDPSHFKGQNRPVESVSWDQATEFCARLSRATNRAYRLPSEAEWEYTCRAGTDTPFSFGQTLSPDIANYDGNHTYGQGVTGKYRGETTDVGSFPANSFGLYDMHGNVGEWCQDLWHDTYEDAPADGTAWTAKQKSDELYRLLRGGSWNYHPWFCRCAYRLGDSPDLRSSYVGFRVACSLAS